METIKVTNLYITNAMATMIQGQIMPNPVMENLKKKKFPAKAQYWIRRILDKIRQNFKILEETRQELIQQHARKDENGKPLIVMRDFLKINSYMKEKKLDVEDLTEMCGLEAELAIKEGFISPKIAEKISKWSEGKISADSDGNVSIENTIEFQKSLNELMDIEIDLGINKIEIDLGKWEANSNIDLLDGEEMDLLLPMLEVTDG